MKAIYHENPQSIGLFSTYLILLYSTLVSTPNYLLPSRYLLNPKLPKRKSNFSVILPVFQAHVWISGGYITLSVHPISAT